MNEYFACVTLSWCSAIVSRIENDLISRSAFSISRSYLAFHEPTSSEQAVSGKWQTISLNMASYLSLSCENVQVRPRDWRRCSEVLELSSSIGMFILYSFIPFALNLSIRIFDSEDYSSPNSSSSSPSFTTSPFSCSSLLSSSSDRSVRGWRCRVLWP